uniref:Uncharacterized protein n=1 Tax=Picea glauca TaxID=3330 RepID=A0A117NG96_PICGL|nr:hypothetical protein ABT39_MTgene1561 [Picea glauca]QHR88345.1 hypothetical protein Q903MT_gene2358 [Picea sitchensis]
MFHVSIHGWGEFLFSGPFLSVSSFFSPSPVGKEGGLPHFSLLIHLNMKLTSIRLAINQRNGERA